MTEPTIRLITASDVEAVREIYLPYVRNTSITFECTEPSIEEFTHKIETIASQYPWVVYEDNAKILGYAYASRHRSKEAYDWSPESTIYVKEGAHGKGIGRKLYQTLFSILKLQGYVNVYAGVTQPNEKSDKLHEAVGFTQLGLFKNIGYKLGKWHDTKWYQLALRDHSENPVTPKSISSIKSTPELAALLKNGVL